MINRIEKTFEKLKADGDKALVSFITAGDPDIEKSEQILCDLPNYGVDIIEVGEGPQDLEFKNNDLYVSRTYYDENYSAFHGTSKFSLNNNDVLIKNYGENTPCGGSVHNFENVMYRSALLSAPSSIILFSKAPDFPETTFTFIPVFAVNFS